MGLLVNSPFETVSRITVEGFVATIKGNIIVRKYDTNQYMAESMLYLYRSVNDTEPFWREQVFLRLSETEITGNIFGMMYTMLKERYPDSTDI